jgi:hypothetical protein
MKKATLLMVGLLFVGLTMANAGETTETAWFDLENCVFCKQLTEDPGLMKNMTWKNYDLTNGVLTVTTVAPEFKESYLKAQKAMMDVGNKMGTGEIDFATADMCGHCQTYGKLMQMGVVFDHVPTDAADIVVMTSNTPETVAEIKAFAKRNEVEMAKMEEQEKAGETK